MTSLSNNAPKDPETVLTPLTPIPFAHVIALQIGGRWHFIETADQALHCLREEFTADDRPSFNRALNTWDAVCAGLVPIESFSAAFIVAAMEAGYPFEVHHDDEALVERRVAAMAENALLDLLLSAED